MPRNDMNFRNGDIQVRNNTGKTTIWISQRLILEVCEISEDFLRTTARKRYKNSIQKCYHHNNVLPDNGNAWRWAKIQGNFYYDLERMPNRAPKFYRSLFGDAERLISKYEASLKSKYLTDLETQFKKHLKAEYPNYLEFYTEANELQRVALAKACAVLDFILDKKDDYPGTKNKLYKDLEPILKDYDLQYIPHHHLKLKEKVDELMQDEQASIVSVIRLPRTNNGNALVYNDPEIRTWVMQMRSMDANYSDAHIIRKVSDMCDMVGKQVPSRRWFGQTIFEMPKTMFLTANKRFGSSRKSNIHKSYIPYENALFSGDCWEIDATRVNIISHEVEAEDGTKKDKYLFIVAIRDVHSGDILGYSFDHSENHMVYAQAMKMAVKYTGYLPYEIVTDKFPGHNTEQMTNLFARMEALGVKVQFTHKATGKAKIERFFRTLQSVTMMDSKYFYGEGIQSRSLSAHRSPEYLKKLKSESKKAGFDMYSAVEESANIIENFRETRYSYYSRKHPKLHKSPKQIHIECEKPNILPISNATTSMLFDSKKEVTIRNNGQIKTEMIGVEMEYFIPASEYEIIANYHNQQVVMSYDNDDLSKVFLWEKHGKLLKSLCEAEYFVRPQKYGPNKRMAQVAAAKAREKVILERRDKELEQAVNEDGLMMGMHTNKIVAELTESLLIDENIIKKASGDGLSHDAIERSILGDYSDY